MSTRSLASLRVTVGARIPGAIYITPVVILLAATTIWHQLRAADETIVETNDRVEVRGERRTVANELTVEELQKLRRQVGRSPLSGTLLDARPGDETTEIGNSRDDAEFTEALRETMHLPASSPTTTTTRDHRSPLAPLDDPQAADYRRLLIDSMRRQLQQIGDDLHQVGLLAEANRVRASAAELRVMLQDIEATERPMAVESTTSPPGHPSTR